MKNIIKEHFKILFWFDIKVLNLKLKLEYLLRLVFMFKGCRVFRQDR